MAAVPNMPEVSFQPIGSIPPGVYCNGLQILFSPWEFNFELAQLAPEATIEAANAPLDQGAQATLTGVRIHKHVVSRIVMSPQHAKATLKVLRENVEKYEAQFGEIPDLPIGPEGGQ